MKPTKIKWIGGLIAEIIQKTRKWSRFISHLTANQMRVSFEFVILFLFDVYDLC